MGDSANFIILNGKLIPREKANIDIEDRGYQFGDGVYEVIRIYNRQFFTLNEHLERLLRSAREIKMSLSYTVEQLATYCKQLVVENDVIDGIVYIQVSRGTAQRTHAFPSASVHPEFVAYTLRMNRPVQQQQEGVKAIVVNDIRWLRCDIKSINLLGNVLAKQEALENDAYEAIQHRDGIVTEGSSTNVFMIKDRIIYTHPANHLILHGITRQKVLQLCEQLHITVKEQPFTTDELYRADEVFITSTTNEIMPIVQIDQHTLNKGKPGALTKQLQQAFNGVIKNSDS